MKIHTQTGVGARKVETHFKAIDFAVKGDGQFKSLFLQFETNETFDHKADLIITKRVTAFTLTHES